MQTVTFQETTLSVVPSTEHTFLMPSKEVAVGYGVAISAIREHNRQHSDELIEGKHFIIDRSYKNTPKTMWTKRGIVRLGFFIKSEKAKAFRDWAEDYVIKGTTENDELQKLIISQNAQIAQLTLELKNKSKRLPPPPIDNALKQTLVKVHDGYHRVLTTCSPIDMMDELRKMTNLFQLIGSDKGDGKNLNTCTKSGHTYWGDQKLLT